MQNLSKTGDFLWSDRQAMPTVLQENEQANGNGNGFALGAHFFLWWEADWYSGINEAIRSDQVREATDLALAEFKKWREQQQAMGISDRDLCELVGAPSVIMQRIADYADGKVAVLGPDGSPDPGISKPVDQPSPTTVAIITPAPRSVGNPSTPQPRPNSSRPDKYPHAERTNNPGFYRSPYTGRIYDLRRVQDGGLVRDPRTGQLFRRPRSR